MGPMRRGPTVSAYYFSCKTFNYRNWESVTDLQHSLQRPTWEDLVEKRRRLFHERRMSALLKMSSSDPLFESQKKNPKDSKKRETAAADPVV